MTSRDWVRLLGLAALWGSSYLFISIAVRQPGGVGPFVLVAARTGGAAALFAPLVWRHRALFAGRWHRLPAIALLQVAAPFTLISAGERWLESGLAGTLVAAQPLWLVLLAPLPFLSLGRPGRRAVAGVVIGFAGVAVLLGGTPGAGPGAASGGHRLLGAAFVVTAAGCYAVGAALVRRWTAGIPPAAVTGAVMGTSTLLVAPLAVVTLPAAVPSAPALGALAALAFACTAGAFVLFNGLIADAGPARASLVAYLSPAFAVAYGAVLLHEPVGPATALGLAAILLGSRLSTRTPARRSGPRRLPWRPASWEAHRGNPADHPDRDRDRRVRREQEVREATPRA